MHCPLVYTLLTSYFLEIKVTKEWRQLIAKQMEEIDTGCFNGENMDKKASYGKT